MTTFRAIALAAIAAFGIAYATGPAGSSNTGTCGAVSKIMDPGLRDSFAKFEAHQSGTAAKICAIYRNGL